MPTTGSSSATGPTPIVVPRQASDGLHAHLLRVTASNSDGQQVRAGLRRVIQDVTGAASVLHLHCDETGQFSFDRIETEGDIPLSGQAAEQLLTTAAMALQRGATQVKSLAEGSQVICAPVSTAGSAGEVLAALVVFEVSNFHSALFTVELAANYQRFWARGNVAAANQWKLNSLAAIVELVSTIEQHRTVDAAASSLVNDIAKHLGCARVALATAERHNLKLRAISGLNDFDSNSESVTLIREAMAESLLSGELRFWPPNDDGDDRSALLAHQSLARQSHFQSLLTSPLKNIDGRTIGVWLFADSRDVVTGPQFKSFVRTASPRVASAIQIVRRDERSMPARIKHRMVDFISGRKGKLALVGLALLLGIMSLPLPYRIRCQCVVQPVTRRFAVAPFEGMIDQTYVEAGDIVSEGTLLAEMDGRELRWELSAAEAERGQVMKKREIELADRNVPEVLISQLQAEELNAKIDVLRYRAAHLQLKSPAGGVVLSGSLEKGQTSPVQTGDVLFEIGPLETLRIEIEVPADEVAQIAAGQQVKIWINGFESEPLSVEVQQLQPRSELRNDQNVFVAKVTIDNSDKRLRPGMRGSARITGKRHPLVWNLLHKPWQYAVSRLTWW